MTLFYNLKKLAAIFFITPILLNCSGESQATTIRSPESKNYAKVAKPGAPVKLVSEASVFINANQPTQIIIELETSELGGYLGIDFIAGNGLEILNTETHQTLDLSSNSLIKFPVTLLAYTDGRYYLNMQVRVENGESSSTRTLALIVQAGNGADKKIQFKKMSEADVISMPAQEKISTQPTE